MRVEFDATLSDCVDVMKRSVARSGKSNIWFLKGAYKSALWSGLPTMLLPLGSFKTRIWTGCAAAAIGALTHWFTHRKRLERAIFDVCQKISKGSDLIRVEVEVEPEGMRVCQMGKEQMHRWSTIESVEETDDAIYFYEADGLCLAVRNRAFGTQQERQKFLEIVDGFISGARTPFGPPSSS